MTLEQGDFGLIRYHVQERVARITLYDPATYNAITHGPASMDADIMRALDLAMADDNVRCVIFSGSGGNFSSGGSLASGHPAGDAGSFLHFMDMADEGNAAIRAFPKPTIGAIEGICYGAALIMALHLDILVASENAKLGFIETRFGGPGIETLPFFINLQWAKFLAMSGELISAKRARDIGLVLECFPPDVFPDKVDDLARRIAAMPRDGVMLNRRLLNAVSGLMGWNGVHAELSKSINAITNSLTDRAEAADGRLLLDVLEKDGWKAFKNARDTPFQTPWLSDQED